MFSNRSHRFVLLSNEHFVLISEEQATRTREAVDREGAMGCLKIRRVMQFLNLLNTQDNEIQIKKMGVDKVQ